MQQTNFHPNVSDNNVVDSVSASFLKLAQNILVLVIGLLPILFVPVSYAPFNFSKTMLVVMAMTVVLLFLSFSILRSGRVSLQLPLVLVGLWIIAGVSLMSAILSGDISDSLLGGNMGVRTALFAVLLALVATMTGILKSSRTAIIRLYLLLVLSSCILFFYHVMRMFFGIDALSFGIFSSSTSTPLGDWNDLAVFFGLIIVMVMMALEQLPLAKISRYFLCGVVVAGLFMLAVINYSAVWWVLGVVGLVQLMYTLTKDRFSGEQLPVEESSPAKMLPIVMTSLVFVISLAFVIAGSSIGGFISEKTGISYIEVRPSITATLDITRQVYAENPVLGVGSNRFADAWRQFKNTQINETVFWNTNFEAGSGYIPTALVNNGILGGLAWVFFLGALLYTGARLMFSTVHVDKLWYFIATSSLLATLYFWAISIIYNPATVMLLVAAACTGVYALSYSKIIEHRTYTFAAGRSRALSVALIGLVMIAIVGSVSGVYSLSRHYVALWGFNKALASVQEGDEIDVLEAAVTRSYQTAPNDSYARELAYYQVLQLNSLLQVQDPADTDYQKFEEAAAIGIQAAQAAVTLDPTDPSNHMRMGEVYSLLSIAGVEGAGDRAVAAFAEAARLDPRNPQVPFVQARHAALSDDNATAKQFANQAVSMKSNYTEALILLAQLEIADGNTAAAIANVRSVITFEPNNPARYYQLGILLLDQKSLVEAKAALSRAIGLDNNYANARYYLAAVYLQEGNSGAALEQLRVVSELNPDNQEIKNLIDQVEAGDLNAIGSSDNQANTEVDTPSSGTNNDDVTVEEDPETDLVTPVNTIPAEGEVPDESNSETSDEGS